jgi:hypothetical protein
LEDMLLSQESPRKHIHHLVLSISKFDSVALVIAKQFVDKDVVRNLEARRGLNRLILFTRFSKKLASTWKPA